MTTITAAVATAPHTDFTIRQAELDAPRAGEVLVRIRGVGLCHTDLIARDQFIPIPLPVVLGHEGAGIVEAVGSGVTDIAPGDHVVLSFSSCGSCPRCDEALPAYCQSFPGLNYSGRRADGSATIKLDGQEVSAAFFGQSSFASYALAARRNVVKVGKSAPIELLGPLGCGVQTGAGAILRSLKCPAGSSLAIFGGGTVGLSAVMAAKIAGCNPIIVIEPVEARRKLALEFGATHVIDPKTEQSVPDAVRKIAPAGVDFAFESSGLVPVVEAALASLGSHGTLGLVGVPPRPEDSLTVNLASAITFGHQIKGIIEGDSDIETFIPYLVELHAQGHFPFDRMIRTFKLTEINEAVEAHHAGTCIKAVLLPE